MSRSALVPLNKQELILELAEYEIVAHPSWTIHEVCQMVKEHRDAWGAHTSEGKKKASGLSSDDPEKQAVAPPPAMTAWNMETPGRSTCRRLSAPAQSASPRKKNLTKKEILAEIAERTDGEAAGCGRRDGRRTTRSPSPRGCGIKAGPDLDQVAAVFELLEKSATKKLREALYATLHVYQSLDDQKLFCGEGPWRVCGQRRSKRGNQHVLTGPLHKAG